MSGAATQQMRAGATHDAARRLHSLGLAVQLVPEALDVVQAVGNDNVVPREHALHGRVLLGARILLGSGCVVDAARHTQRLVVDQVHLQATAAPVGALTRDAGFQRVLELAGTRRLPRRGVARDDDELQASVPSSKSGTFPYTHWHFPICNWRGLGLFTEKIWKKEPYDAEFFQKPGAGASRGLGKCVTV